MQHAQQHRNHIPALDQSVAIKALRVWDVAILAKLTIGASPAEDVSLAEPIRRRRRRWLTANKEASCPISISPTSVAQTTFGV